jgi:hypothetical protein
LAAWIVTIKTSTVASRLIKNSQPPKNELDAAPEKKLRIS